MLDPNGEDARKIAAMVEQGKCPDCSALRSEIARIRKIAVDRIEEQRKLADALRARVAELSKRLERTLTARYCARQVSAWDWGTSVSEDYHRRRMNAMDQLRAALAKTDPATCAHTHIHRGYCPTCGTLAKKEENDAEAKQS